MHGDSLASGCASQSIFAPASPEVPTLVVGEGALAAREGCRCWDVCMAWAGKGAAVGLQQQPLSPLGCWCGGLFAASREMHPLMSLSHGGLGALSAGGERLMMLIATSKCFSRHMTGRAALRSALLRGCCSSASLGTRAGPLCLGCIPCHLLPHSKDESLWTRGQVVLLN